tara:strand:+ start:126 stop:254 length:129 start_codon:yes stop_codon:yes gene_type:complete
MTLTDLIKAEILKEKAILDGINSKIVWFISGFILTRLVQREV